MQQAQQAPADAKQTLPIGMRIANAMHKTGVAGLPRNYEIFYLALTGTNEQLKSELWESGNSLNQEALDKLHSKHCARADDEALVSKICDALDDKLGETIGMIKKEYGSVSSYGKVLVQATERLGPDTKLQPDMVDKMVGLLLNATKATEKQGQATLKGMQDTSTHLETMKTELEEYKRLAETDALTGLFNRRAFDLKLAELEKNGLQKAALLLGDIDKFKSLNDTYGHQFGDMVLRGVANIATANTREDIFVARVGGEEFAVIGENVSDEGMVLLAERLRIAIAENAFTDGRIKLSPAKVTISFGACHGGSASNGQEMYSGADEALYASKRSGRNKVTSFSDLNTSPDRKNLFLYRS